MKCSTYTRLKASNTIFLFLLLSPLLQAQEWQWGKSGGSPVLGLEEVRDMAVDQNGNLYFVARFQGEYAPMLDGIPLPHYGATDYLIASYTCEGELRWKKVIGGYSHDIPYSIGVDTLGNVTVIGRSTLTQVIYPPPFPNNTNVHFDTDTILDWVGSRRYYVIRYDTAGVFQWLKMPGPGQNPTSQEVFRSLNVEPNGNFHLFAALDSGSVYSSAQFPVNETGFYVMQYNVSGEQIGLIPLDINSSSNSFIGNMNMAFCPLYEQYYLAGHLNTPSPDTIFFGNNPLIGRTYVCAFDALGNQIWFKQASPIPSNSSGFGFRSKISIAENGNLYISGNFRHQEFFDTIYIQNQIGPHGIPIIMSFNPQGNILWYNSGNTNGATQSHGLALDDNFVYITGGLPGMLFWDSFGDTLITLPNSGRSPYLSKFLRDNGQSVNQTMIGTSFGNSSDGRVLEADHHGNVYMGGDFTGQLYIGPDTLQHMGGQTDFFIARYGEVCPCDLPVAAFTAESQVGSLWASFNFTGFNTDSLQWSFGDGQVSHLPEVDYAYAAAGTYEVCLTVWNTCGEETLCQSITIVCDLPDPQFTHTTSETGATLHLSIPDTSATAATWDFGDGQTGTGLQVSHTYAEEGTYEVCATVTSPCGTETHCEAISIQFVSTTMPGIFSEVNIFPNPANRVLHLHNLPDGTGYTLYSITGQEIALPENPAILSQNAVLNISNVPPGSYLLRLQTSTGESRNFLVLVGR